MELGTTYTMVSGVESLGVTSEPTGTELRDGVRSWPCCSLWVVSLVSPVEIVIIVYGSNAPFIPVTMVHRVPPKATPNSQNLSHDASCFVPSKSSLQTDEADENEFKTPVVVRRLIRSCLHMSKRSGSETVASAFPRRI